MLRMIMWCCRMWRVTQLRNASMWHQWSDESVKQRLNFSRRWLLSYKGNTFSLLSASLANILWLPFFCVEKRNKVFKACDVSSLPYIPLKREVAWPSGSTGLWIKRLPVWITVQASTFSHVSLPQGGGLSVWSIRWDEKPKSCVLHRRVHVKGPTATERVMQNSVEIPPPSGNN